MPYVSGRIARVVAASVVSAAALGCLSAMAFPTSDGSSNVRRPLIASAGIGNIAPPFFPDGIGVAADVPAADLVASTEAVPGADGNSIDA